MLQTRTEEEDRKLLPQVLMESWSGKAGLPCRIGGQMGAEVRPSFQMDRSRPSGAQGDRCDGGHSESSCPLNNSGRRSDCCSCQAATFPCCFLPHVRFS